MRNRWKIISGAVAILLLFIITGIYTSYKEKVPPNDISVTGNTAGNLNNRGLFAENSGKVYFSNAYDGGDLYSMNPDETDLQKLTDTPVTSINTAGNHLYFYMDNLGGGDGEFFTIRTYGVYRTDLKGKHRKSLDRNAAVTMQLVGDYLYYQRYNNQDFTSFYKVKTDKSEIAKVSDDIINPAACCNGIIYFNGTGKDHYLYALDTRTDTISTVYEGNLWYPAYQDGYIYYMDVSSNYRLCRYSLGGNYVEVLTSDRVDTFNVGANYIYYQKNSLSDPALMRMNLDGSNPEVVALGNYENINLTSQYAYFNAFGADVPVYHTPVNGPVSVTAFTAAESVAVP